MGGLFGQFEKWLDIVQLEIIEIHSVAEQGFTKPLHCKLSNGKNNLDWQKWWADVPESWKEANHNFDEQRTLKRLTDEAHGNIWLKL